MKTIFSFLKPYRLRISVAVFIKAIGAMADLALPLIIAIVIDDVIPTENKQDIYLFGGLMILISIFGLVTNIIANRMAARVAANSTQNIRHALFSKIEHLSASQVDYFTNPSLISRMTTDTYNVHRFTGMIQRIAIRAPMLLLGGIIMAMMIDVPLTLALIAILPPITFVVIYSSKKGIPLFKFVQTRVDRLIQTLRENITGVRVVKALSMSDYEIDRFDEVNQATVTAEKKATLTMAAINPIMQMITNTGLVAVLIFGAYRVNQGLTKPGQIIAFVTYFTIILNAMMIITRIFVMFSRASASAARIEEVLLTEPDIIDGSEDIIIDTTKPHITFENVSFSYSKNEMDIKDVNFSIYKGETLAIIGGTGSGKTTLINLLLRFYDLDRGSIKLYGKDIKTIKQSALRGNVGVVLQNDVLFADTVIENIRFSRSDMSDEEVRQASEIAQADSFISDLQDRYETTLSQRATNLSGGQKQRILIARALAGHPDIVILDDSSSALDYQTDANLRVGLRKKLKESTKIIIAQRVSSVRSADLILVLDEGRIVASGKHDDLMKNCDLYQEIAQSQMGGEHV